jgi:hypothetical protein
MSISVNGVSVTSLADSVMSDGAGGYGEWRKEQLCHRDAEDAKEKKSFTAKAAKAAKTRGGFLTRIRRRTGFGHGSPVLEGR